jgi:RNA polymerase sigma-70 factor, ECF subfamily
MGDNSFMAVEGNILVEKAIIEKAITGDSEAFETLVESYRKKVFNISLRMLGNYDDASEAAQDVFVRIFRSIKNFRKEAMLSTWIYRITVNVCTDILRKKKNSKVISLDEEIKTDDSEIKLQIEDNKPQPQDQAESNELRKAVRKAISLLPENYRMIIILRDIQGMSYEEISRILKTPEGTVKSRLNRARLALKDIVISKRELFEERYVKQMSTYENPKDK